MAWDGWLLRANGITEPEALARSVVARDTLGRGLAASLLSGASVVYDR